MADTDRDPDGKPITSANSLADAKTEAVVARDSHGAKHAGTFGAASDEEKAKL